MACLERVCRVASRVEANEAIGTADPEDWRPRTCGRRELGGTEKSIHVHPFIIVILFLRTLNIDIDILFMHQALITPAYFVHIKIPTNSVPTQLAC